VLSPQNWSLENNQQTRPYERDWITQMKKVINNCIFGYQCDKSWNDLEPTNDSNIRHCNKCNHQVHYCPNPETLMNAIQSKLCVAVDIEHDKKIIRTLGYPSTAYLPDFLKSDS